MQRKTLDRLLAAGGLVVAAVLLVAGGLLTWASNYVHDEVHDQLSAQRIYFPPEGSEALASPEIGPHLNKYAGEQLTTGPQAKAYADHFIKVHLNESTGNRTYSELSSASRENPEDTELKGLVDTAFRGETLRGLLLNAYAFDTMGDIAGIAAIVAYVGAALMLLLAVLGFIHARRVAAVADTGPPGERRTVGDDVVG